MKKGARLLLCLPCACAVHVAFIAPPASHYVPMIAIAHGLLDQGHQVTFLALEETVKKLQGVVPNATMVVLEGQRPMSSAGVKKMQGFPTVLGQIIPNMIVPLLGVIIGTMLAYPAKEKLLEVRPDVLCVSYVYPMLYALGELLDIPVVGIGWGTPSWLAIQTEPPWSLEPNMGSVYTRKELYTGGLGLLFENVLCRTVGTLFMGIGSMINAYHRWRLGHQSPLEVWEFDTILQHPMITMSLPELTAGLPMMVGVYTFWVGILDHPQLAEGAFAKSEDTQKIIRWLDARHTAGEKVLYFAFGSEVYIEGELAQFMANCFERGGFHVLWANKVNLEVQLPPSVLHTKFAPQRAVLQHPAVFGFLSHGGQNSVNEALMFGTPLVIMPFFGDQVVNARSNEALGVAVMVHKETRDPDIVVAAVHKIMGEPFQKRSQDIAELNRQRRDMSRAIEIITNQATGKFRLQIQRAPGLQRLFILVMFLAGIAFCCARCCCCRVTPQRPCCCRPRRGGGQGTKGKKD